MEDVTEREQLEQMREDLIHTMVHDLRNPLNGIMAALDLLRLQAGSHLPEKSLAMVDIAKQSSERMLNLINAILEINRLENGSMPLARRRSDLANLASETLQLQLSQAAAKSLRIDNEIAAGLPSVWVDRFLISRVIQNLLDNAIKFTPKHGHIRLEAAQTGPKEITVAVSNDGPRIEPDVRDRLFDKFVVGSIEGRGSGLGLAFCRLAVEAHGGRIDVASDDAQTTFNFTLPCYNGSGADPYAADISHHMHIDHEGDHA
jgi:signal transduction histidine kinase